MLYVDVRDVARLSGLTLRGFSTGRLRRRV
jgi:hypothetical protein